MICKVYKNGNFTIRRDDLDAPAETLEDLICAISNDLDAPDVAAVPDAVEPCALGNDCGAYFVAFHVNGAPRSYRVTPDDLDAYNAGHTARMICDGLAPQFVMPTFCDYYGYTTPEGVRGTIYKLADPISDEDRNAVTAAGCAILETRAQYAPEIRHDAVFVPYGICFSFC
jgi:hypothetical protein